jgi:hypothetical protein
VKDLYDNTTEYIKTVCLVALEKTYDGADQKCQSQKMFLYYADDPQVERALVDFSNTQFRPSTGATLYIHGKTTKGCLVVNNSVGLFNVSFIDCSELHYFYCQFKRTPKTENDKPSISSSNRQNLN